MKKYTLLISIVVHVCAVVAVYLSPLLASDELPTPRSRIQWTPAVPVALPPSTPSLVRRSRAASTAPAVPLSPPDGIQEEAEAGTSGTGREIDEREGLDDGRSFFGGAVAGGGVEAPPPPVPSPAPRQVAPVRPGGLVERPTKVVDVAPVYPSLAVQARQEGSVILEAVIAEDGSVREVRVLRSIPLLDGAATEAVRRWRFTPTRLNGTPVAVLMTVTVTFRLNR